MSDYTPYSLKHFTALRKVLKSKQSGTLLFQTSSGNKKRLQFSQSQIIHNGEAYMQETLHSFFSENITSIAWRKENTSLLGEQAISSVSAICSCLNDVKWSPSQVQKLTFEFSKLPSVNVRMVALHQYAFRDSLIYLQFYQNSLLQHHFRPADFLKEGATITSHVRVLVLAYCLNLFVPRTTVQNVHTHEHKKEPSSLAERILQRVRGI